MKKTQTPPADYADYYPEDFLDFQDAPYAEGEEKWHHVFTAGKYPQGDQSEEDLASMTAEYNRKGRRESPVVLDHAYEGPALGWIKALKAEKNKLYVCFSHLDPELISAVRAKRYRYTSPRIRTDEKGRKALIHLSIQGAWGTADTRHKPLEFSSQTNTHGESSMNPQETNPSSNDPPTQQEVGDYSKEKIQEILIENQKLKQSAIQAAAEKEIKKLGTRITPAMRELGIVELYSELKKIENSISYGRDDMNTAKPAEILYGLLKALPDRDRLFQRESIASSARAPKAEVYRNANVDEASLATHQRALEYCQTNQLDANRHADYRRAVAAVS